MRRPMVSDALTRGLRVVALLASFLGILALGGPLGAQEPNQCCCSYQGPGFSCNHCQTCAEGNYPECSCTVNGCTGTCTVGGGGQGGPPFPLKEGASGRTESGQGEENRAHPNQMPPMHYESISLRETNLTGIKDHFESHKPTPWKVVLAVDSSRRLFVDYSDLSVQQLVRKLAEQFDVCGKVYPEMKTISFTGKGSCDRQEQP